MSASSASPGFTSSPPDPSLSPPPDDTSSLYRKMTGCAAFACLVRVYQLGILRRKINSSPMSYVLSIVGGAGVGYGLYNVERRQTYLLAKKTRELLEKREQSQDIQQFGETALPA